MSTSCFEFCKKLTTVSFASNSILKEIPSLSFSNCSSLTSISIPDSVKKIDLGAFYTCTNLRTVSINYLSSNLTDIKVNAFSYCYNLSSVVLPKSLYSIDISAFEGCQSLT